MRMFQDVHLTSNVTTYHCSLRGCPEGGCPRHVERNYVPLFGVAQSNVDFTSYCYLNIVVPLYRSVLFVNSNMIHIMLPTLHIIK